MIKSLHSKFNEVFNNKENTRTFFSPGRVNLIGEHIDYNGGYVFPCALSIGTYAVVKKRADKKVRLYSENFSNLGIMEFNLDYLVYEKIHDWANYPKGIIKELIDRGFRLNNGFDILFFGTIPNGAGLSSSASLEVLMAIICKELFNLNISQEQIALLSQKVENEFMGVNCGIMDQFIISVGRKDHAIMLNTDSLDFNYVPLKLEGVSIVIANTNKRRGLADSKYNERRKECDKALETLQQETNIPFLCDLNYEKFHKLSHLFNSNTIYRRAKHAVTENDRTKKAYEVLLEGNIIEFGKLMNESHISLRDDYEVSCYELDVLVSKALSNNAIGARMTGAGFGGCAVMLVKNEDIDLFIKNVGESYLKQVGYCADFYIASIWDGAKEIKE